MHVASDARSNKKRSDTRQFQTPAFQHIGVSSAAHSQDMQILVLQRI